MNSISIRGFVWALMLALAACGRDPAPPAETEMSSPQASTTSSGGASTSSGPAAPSTADEMRGGGTGNDAMGSGPMGSGSSTGIDSMGNNTTGMGSDGGMIGMQTDASMVDLAVTPDASTMADVRVDARARRGTTAR